MTKTPLVVANESIGFPKVKLVEPAPSGYVHIAAEVDGRPPFVPSSRRKRWLIEVQASSPVEGASLQVGRPEPTTGPSR